MQTTIEQRLVELETKSAYQEEALHVLGAEIARQQKRIEQLERGARQLLDRLAAQAEPVHQGSLRDEIPPHY